MGVIRRAGVALIALAVLAGACGDDGDGAGDGVAEPPAPTTTATAACSAAGLPASVDAQRGLPEPVADLRGRIVAAAVTCDYDRLSKLADEVEPGLTFSFGDDDDPAEFWADVEADEAGSQPLRLLAELLRLPYGTQPGGEGGEFYVWPRAFTYESWDAVPDADRDALRGLFDERDFEFFEEFGGYVGYRVGITAAGDWVYFVAGD